MRKYCILSLIIAGRDLTKLHFVCTIREITRKSCVKRAYFTRTSRVLHAEHCAFIGDSGRFGAARAEMTGGNGYADEKRIAGYLIQRVPEI